MEQSWLELANFHKYEDFGTIETIGRGASGKVSRAKWANRDMSVAIKSFSNIDNDNFVKEVITIFYDLFMW